MKHLLLTTIAAVVLVGCGGSSIHDAAKEGSIALVRRELSRGVDVNSNNYKRDANPLHLAAGHGHRQIVKLLIDKGGNVDAKAEGGGTPLMMAAFNGYTEIAELLIKNGADVNAKDVVGMTAIDLAIHFKESEFANLLRKHGGKKGKGWQSKGTYKRTPKKGN